MGQQQLLLVILVTIIVGIATVVAINAFGSAADNANLDAVRNDVASIAASAQGFYMKPTALGGGGQNFSNIAFTDLAFGADSTFSSTKVSNANGTYVISGSNGTLTVTAYPASADNYVVGGTSTNDLEAEVTAEDLNFTDNNPDD